MWISTKDQTPTLRQRVMLFTKYREIVIGQLDDRIGEPPLNVAYILATDSPDEEYTLVGPVTHWMPLPDGPA